MGTSERNRLQEELRLRRKLKLEEETGRIVTKKEKMKDDKETRDGMDEKKR